MSRDAFGLGPKDEFLVSRKARDPSQVVLVRKAKKYFAGPNLKKKSALNIPRLMFGTRSPSSFIPRLSGNLTLLLRIGGKEGRKALLPPSEIGIPSSQEDEDEKRDLFQ